MCCTSSGTSRAFSGTGNRSNPNSRSSTGTTTSPKSTSRATAGTSACGNAPSTAAAKATSTAPSSSPVPKYRITGLSRQTDALSRNAEL
jgi:hypothetical protein